jgi:hypothetical protein
MRKNKNLPAIGGHVLLIPLSMVLDYRKSYVFLADFLYPTRFGVT